MFLALLLVTLVGAGLHIFRSKPSREGAGELLLVWILVGYCGLPMVLVALGGLIRPDAAAEILGFPAGNPFQAFLFWGYLGMSILALLAVRYRGGYLIGPAIVWGVFFTGATGIHLHQPMHGGGHSGVAMILLTHLMIVVLLATGLAMSGVLKGRGGLEA